MEGESTTPAATAEVTRESISDTRSFGGSLGHGDAATVTTSSQGVITRLVDQGAEVARGLELLRLNEQPVTALYGVIPMYRDLQAGDSGIDVEQLEANLAELGYEGFTVDDEFTWGTEVAVQEWQADIGAPETGVVAQADVVFVPKNSRVDTIHTDIGDVVTPGSAVLDLTGSDQAVSLDVEIRDRELLEVGTEVIVQLPSGDEVAGTVTTANAVEAEAPGEGGPDDDEAAGSDDTVMRVEVTLSETVDESFLGTPLDVLVEVDERSDVLTVPINALLALTGGDHGVEVVAADGTTSLVEVRR